MARRRTIVGVGEALLAETGDETAPAGFALSVALSAAILGHRGVPVSRLGQDPAAEQLLDILRSADVGVAHLQSDPDLSTGRLLIRGMGPVTKRTLDAWAAFDNLQWDFDLDDLAQIADGMVFGAFAMRSGQTRSVIQRLLAASTSAVKIVDLSHRPEDEPDRALMTWALDQVDGAWLDNAAVAALESIPLDDVGTDAVQHLVSRHHLSFAVVVDSNRIPVVFAGSSSTPAKTSIVEHDSFGVQESAVTALLHGILAGWGFDQAVNLSVRLAQHVAEHGWAPPTQDWINA